MSHARITARSVPTLATTLHDNPLMHRLLAARGVKSASELEFALADLPRPDSLPGIDKAIARLLTARDQQQRILVVGDYDCDGATSTCVAIKGLRMLGFDQVDYVIPSRFRFGYGLSPAIVDVARIDYHADLILTVDNGVASVDGVAHANTLGIDVIVTDHHLAPKVLPSACAIINPNIPGSRFAGQHLAGVGVIFYTLLALRAELQRRNDPASKAPLAALLDLVAIGTVADVVPLDNTNRTLVEQGLRRIRCGVTRPGVLALLRQAGRLAPALSTQDIGFGIAPRINAAGRLEDMRIGVQCLLADTQEEADQLAHSLNELNKQRRSIEQSMRREAQAQLNDHAIAEQVSGLHDAGAFGVCLIDENWHQGVIGILAGRIKDTLHRPTIVFTLDDDHNLKGSARSIPGVHIRDVLQAIVTRHPGMIEKFGGHAMAAGLSLPRRFLEPFRQAFDEAVKQAVNGRYPEREYSCDGSLTEQERTLGNARLMSHLMPWGQGFEPPEFVDQFTVVSRKVVGNGHLKLGLCSEAARDRVLDAIAFNCSVEVQTGDRITLVYALEVNTWQERESLQLRVRYMEAVNIEQAVLR